MYSIRMKFPLKFYGRSIPANHIMLRMANDTEIECIRYAGAHRILVRGMHTRFLYSYYRPTLYSQLIRVACTAELIGREFYLARPPYIDDWRLGLDLPSEGAYWI